MRRLLRVLAQETSALERSGDADPGLMCDVLRYLIEYSGRQHHPIEHLALWRLVQHGHVARPIADELDFEHRTVRHYGGQLQQLLEGTHGEVLAPRAWIGMAAHQYAGALRAHMTHEERALLPLVERQLAPSDWEEIKRAAMSTDDPVESEIAERRLQRLYALIAERTNANA